VKTWTVGLALGVVFAIGVLAGQSIGTAGAQTQPVDEKAGIIKTGLVDAINQQHSLFRGELATALQNDGFDTASPYGRALVGMYFDTITPAARDDAMLGQYFRYMAPALMRKDFPKALLEDRFLDHFSQSVASTGLPPAFPAFTDAEIRDTNTRTRNMLMMTSGNNPWPFSWSGTALLSR
jgi:hypothetical protein